MKKLLILAVWMLSASMVSAQEPGGDEWDAWVSTLTKQYPSTVGKDKGVITVKRDGNETVTYYYVNTEYSIELWRSDARFRGVSWAFKTGGYPPENYPEIYTSPSVSYNAMQAVYKIMPEWYYPIVSGCFLNILVVFDSSTGEVSDIVFKFDPDYAFSLVSPEIFDQIDREMRRVLRVNPTPAGQQLNYLMSGSGFYFGGDPYE